MKAALMLLKEICTGIIILEHVTDVDFTGFEMLKQKNTAINISHF